VNRGRWEPSCASLATLGPRWVRVTTVEHGHERSPTVAHGSEEPQVAGPSAQAAEMTQTGIQAATDDFPDRPVYLGYRGGTKAPPNHRRERSRYARPAGALRDPGR
jgi:hypothetical protein